MLNLSLDIARGLAALWVFLYHIRLGIEPGFIRRLAEGGFLGVPLFFVISGYCMMASSRGTMAKGQTAGAFLKRRLRRIFPPFWASILIVIAVPFVATVIYTLHGAAITWPQPAWFRFSPRDWLMLVTLTKGLGTTGAAHKPWSAVNSVYWSLAIEVQFYLVIAAALVFRRRFAGVLLAVSAGSIAWWRLGPVAPGLFFQYWIMFAFGLLLHVALEKGWRPVRLFGPWTVPASGAAAATALGMMLSLTLCSPSQTLERQTVVAFLCGLALWAGSGIEPMLPRERLGPRALAGLGKMSYSLYLLHIQLSSLVMGLLRPVVPRMSLLSPLLSMAGTLPLAWLFYEVCEKRFAGRRGG